MDKHRTEATIELAVTIGRLKPDLSAYRVTQAVLKLAKAAHSLHGRYEAACSYEWATTEKYEKTTERREAAARKIAEELGVDLEFQRDPRGWPLIVMVDGKELGRLG